MSSHSRFVVPALLAVVLCSGACGPAPDPQQLFDEAESLRLRYDKAATSQAIAAYQAAMAAWERRGETRAAARAGQRVGMAYGQLGALRESVQGYQAALSLARASGDPELESETLAETGIAQILVAETEGEAAEATTLCERAVELGRQSQNDRALAKGLDCLGEAAYYSGDLEQALGFYVQAGPLWERLGDEQGRAQNLLYLGYSYSDLSRFDEAADCYARAWSIWTRLGESRQRAITLVGRARVHVRRGEFQTALNLFDQALVLLGPMGDAVWEGSGMTGVATVYRDMGENDLALRHWERALQLFDEAGLRTTSVDVLISLGSTYLASGDDASALDRLERARRLADELDNPRWQAKALLYIGLVHVLRHRPDLALPFLDGSLGLQASLGDRKFEARTRTALGEAYRLLHEPGVAARYFDEALALARDVRDRVTEARGLFGLAETYVGLDDLEAGRAQVERALAVAESLRTEVESRDLRASYLASVYRWHELHTDVLMRLDRRHPGEHLAAAAFEASERGRARALLESLADARVDLRSDVDPDLLERERVLKLDFDEWAARERTRSAGPDAAAEDRALTEEYRDLEERYQQVQAEIRSQSPRYAALAQPQPLSLSEVQAQVLDADTLLLEYALGEERSYLWAVSATGQSSYTLPPRAEIEQAAERVHALLTTRLTAAGSLADRQRRVAQADAEYWREASRLSDVLLGPVASRMTGKRILVVTDGALQYLPFAALPVPGARDGPVPMVVEHEIVHLPSASVLAVLRRESAGRAPPARTVAVLADPVFEADDPRLQGRAADASQPGGPSGHFAWLRDGQAGVPRLAATRHEADAIIAAAPEGTTWRALDFEASRATAMSPELAEYRIVHFATHGVFDNENPGLSGVILSMFDAEGHPQDGFLRLRDIYGLDLPAELVVLSACNTALGRQIRGEGLVGIVRGFMYAGAKRVVASLWKVDDEATGELMTRFYRHMLEERRSPAAALRQAQLELWRQDRWRPPFYWAAFVLQGEWR